MVNINILGDFCVKDLNGLMISEELQGILNDGDINVPGGNHLKLIVVNQIGIIVYETKVMNF